MGIIEMMLPWLIAVPILGGLLAWLLERAGTRWTRVTAIVALGIQLLLTVYLGFGSRLQGGPWLADFQRSWIPRFGIHVHLAMDGLSLLLILLTSILGIISILASWSEIEEKVGYFHFNLLWTLAGVTGVFLSLDLFLFYFFWELMLVPMYFLIAIWGHEHRIYAAIKFFIFTQASGLLMLVAILGLYFAHHASTGAYTFDYFALLGTPMSKGIAWWLMLGFFVAFAVKLAGFPFHTWLPDAHTEAPTAGSVILAGLLLKTGAYGLIRFVVPLFPEAARGFAPVAMVLGTCGILYGAVMVFGQRDLKRMIAYTSVSHLGFVMLGIFAWTDLALQGSVMQMICHGFSTGALFVAAGALQERFGTRDMDRFGGLWAIFPRMGGMVLFFAMASLGLPGLGNFVGEFLVLVGAFQGHPWITFFATLGLVAATVYSLKMFVGVFHGPRQKEWHARDLHSREIVELGVMVLLLLYLGLMPQWVFDTAGTAIAGLRIYLGS